MSSTFRARINVKKLATIITDIDIEFNETKLTKEFNRDKIKTIFTELEFRNLAKRVLGEEIDTIKKDVNENQKEGKKAPSTSGRIYLGSV